MSADREERALKEAIARAVAGTGFVDRERLGFNAGYRAAVPPGLADLLARLEGFLSERSGESPEKAQLYREVKMAAAALVASPTPEGDGRTHFLRPDAEDSGNEDATACGALPLEEPSSDVGRVDCLDCLRLLAGSSTPEADEAKRALGEVWRVVRDMKADRDRENWLPRLIASATTLDLAAAAGVPGEMDLSISPFRYACTEHGPQGGLAGPLVVKGHLDLMCRQCDRGIRLESSVSLPKETG